MIKNTIFLLLFAVLASFQAPVDKSLLTGKWKLSSHFYVDVNAKKLKKQFCDLTNYSPEITLLADGSYITTSKGKTIQKGKWKLNPGNVLFFYNNQDVPDDPKANIVDHGVTILLLDKDQLIIREVVCNEAVEGKSTYTRIK
jgi:hypothetical protein